MHCTLVFLGTGTILDVFHITGIWHLVKETMLYCKLAEDTITSPKRDEIFKSDDIWN